MTETPDPSQNGQAPPPQPQPNAGAAIEALKTRIGVLRQQMAAQTANQADVVAQTEDQLDYVNSMFMTSQGEVMRLSEENSRLLSRNDQAEARVATLERKVRELGGDPDQIETETTEDSASV